MRGLLFSFMEVTMLSYLKDAVDDLMDVIGLYKNESTMTHEECLTALERELLGRLLCDVQLPDSGYE